MGKPYRPGTGVVDSEKLRTIIQRIESAVMKAIGKHAPMHGPHEGHSVIREELEELWDHVKADTGRSAEARKEAEHVAAMAVRYLYDVCVDTPVNDRVQPAGEYRMCLSCGFVHVFPAGCQK